MTDFPHLSTTEWVEMAKDLLDIHKPNSEMSNGEIRIVGRWLGQMSACGRCDRQRPFCLSLDLMLMLTIVAAEFPEFFMKNGLAPEN